MSYNTIDMLALIQARLGSTRLPRKVLFDLEGQTVLEHVIERVKRSKLISEVMVVTTINKEDIEIVKLCALKKIRVFCGSEDDVLDRYYQAAKLIKPKNIVRITSDCPLIDPKVIDTLLNKFKKENVDFANQQNYPKGLDTAVFSFKALKKSWEEAMLPFDKEHVTSYIRTHPDKFKIISNKSKVNYINKRWPLDTPEDYNFIKIIFKNVFIKNPCFGMKDVLNFLEKNQEVEKINHHLTRNEGYLKFLHKDEIL